MGRLGDTKFKGAGLGELLLAHALRIALAPSRKVGSCAAVVDAKNQKAVEFYKSFGFIPLIGHSKSAFHSNAHNEEIFPKM